MFGVGSPGNLRRLLMAVPPTVEQNRGAGHCVTGYHRTWLATNAIESRARTAVMTQPKSGFGQLPQQTPDVP